MAVRIRLTRKGRKKLPSYRVVVADSRSPRDGRFIETIGFYDPKTDPSTVEIDGEKAKEWLAKGATPSNTVSKILAIAGVIEPVKKPAQTKRKTKGEVASSPKRQAPRPPAGEAGNDANVEEADKDAKAAKEELPKAEESK